MKRWFLALSIIISSCATIYNVPDPDYQLPVKRPSEAQLQADRALANRVSTAVGSVFESASIDLEIRVFNERIFLIGSVFQESLSEEIYKFVLKNFSKAKQVINLLAYRAQPDSMMAFTDFNLRNEINMALLHYGKIDNYLVDIEVFDKRVYLIGYATPKQVDTLVSIISRINGVKKLVILCDFVEAFKYKSYEEVEATSPAKQPNQAQEITPTRIDTKSTSDPANERLGNENAGDIFR